MPFPAILSGLYAKMCLILLCLPLSGIGQSLSPSNIQEHALSAAKDFFPTYLEFLRLPCDAHIPEQLEPNLQWLEQQFGQRGFQVRRLPTAGIPLLVAHHGAHSDKKTLLFYFHTDGQPVDSSKWFQDSPYEPVIKQKDTEGNWEVVSQEAVKQSWDPELRIFARASADDKGPICMFLAAWDALQSVGRVPDYNIKVLLDTEEEIGSPYLPATVQQHAEELSADALLILDGPMHASNQPTLTFGARGIATITLTLYGPNAPQHSGHYGNYVPNPAMDLAQLLASMKDEQGRVSIPGFYEGIELSPELKLELARVPEDSEALKKRLGLARTDQVGDNLQEALQYPSLNIRGLSSAWVGPKVRTIIPATATAEIDIRLVKESDPERLIQLIRDHISNKGYYILEEEPSQEQRLAHPRLLRMHQKIAYQAFRTDYEEPVSLWLTSALEYTFERPPIRFRTMGGSVPISPMIQALGIPAVVFPLVNTDNNQHSPNENLRMGNYLEGVRSLTGLLGYVEE